MGKKRPKDQPMAEDTNIFDIIDHVIRHREERPTKDSKEDRAVLKRLDEFLQAHPESIHAKGVGEAFLSPLHHATVNLLPGVIEVLVRHGANVNGGAGDCTPLHALLWVWRSELETDDDPIIERMKRTIETLKHLGADLSAKDRLGDTPYLTARSESIFRNITDLLRSETVEPDLNIAVKEGNLPTVRAMLEADSLAVRKARNQDRLLFDALGLSFSNSEAARKDQPEIVRLLLEHGVELADSYGTPILVRACQNHAPVEVIRLLLDYGADVNVSVPFTKRQETLLDYARKNSSKEVVKLLRKAAEGKYEPRNRP